MMIIIIIIIIIIIGIRQGVQRARVALLPRRGGRLGERADPLGRRSADPLSNILYYNILYYNIMYIL